MSDDDRPASEHDSDAKHDRRGGRDATTRDRIKRDPNPDRKGIPLSVAIGLLGLLLLIQAAWLTLEPARFWNAVLVGSALLVAGAYNAFRRRNRELGSAGVATFAALLGLWLVASPFLIGLEPGPAETGIDDWITVGVGLLAGGLGAYSAIAIWNRRKEADARETATYDRTGQ